jgi:hypothetical protein
LRGDEAVGVEPWLVELLGLLGASEAVSYRESREGTGGGAVSYVDNDPLECVETLDARSSAVSKGDIKPPDAVEYAESRAVLYCVPVRAVLTAAVLDPGMAVAALLEGERPLTAKVGIAVRSLGVCDSAISYVVGLVHPRALLAAVD